MKLKNSKKEFLKDIKPSINLIDRYVTGESKIQKRKIIKLSSNESPFKTPSNIRKIISKNLIDSNLYPDGDSESLKKSISKKFKINSKQIICGNGSDDILSLIGTAFSRENCEIICDEFGFIFYPIIGRTVGAKVIFSRSNNLKVSPKNILNKITKKTRIIFLANPNNPTGSMISKDSLIKFLLNIPKKVIIVIDGAYAEYVENKDFSDGLELVERFPNLIVTRTFSKIFGLAGFRIGWAYSSQEVIDVLEKIRGPFNVNQVAQKAGSLILRDKAFIKKSINHNNKWKAWTINNINKLGLVVLPSYTNFVLVKIKNNNFSAEDISSKLERMGIKIRYLKNYNLKDYIRISIGLEKDLKKLIKYLKIILNEGENWKKI